MNGLAKVFPGFTMVEHAAKEVLQEEIRQPAPLPEIRKYVVTTSVGKECVVVFSREIQHSHIMQVGAVSAGFFVAMPGAIKVMTDIPSTSLGLKPRPQDQQLLERFFGL